KKCFFDWKQVSKTGELTDFDDVFSRRRQLSRICKNGAGGAGLEQNKALMKFFYPEAIDGDDQKQQNLQKVERASSWWTAFWRCCFNSCCTCCPRKVSGGWKTSSKKQLVAPTEQEEKQLPPPKKKEPPDPRSRKENTTYTRDDNTVENVKDLDNTFATDQSSSSSGAGSAKNYKKRRRAFLGEKISGAEAPVGDHNIDEDAESELTVLSPKSSSSASVVSASEQELPRPGLMVGQREEQVEVLSSGAHMFNILQKEGEHYTARGSSSAGSSSSSFVQRGVNVNDDRVDVDDDSKSIESSSSKRSGRFSDSDSKSISPVDDDKIRPRDNARSSPQKKSSPSQGTTDEPVLRKRSYLFSPEDDVDKNQDRGKSETPKETAETHHKTATTSSPEILLLEETQRIPLPGGSSSGNRGNETSETAVDNKSSTLPRPSAAPPPLFTTTEVEALDQKTGGLLTAPGRPAPPPLLPPSTASALGPGDGGGGFLPEAITLPTTASFIPTITTPASSPVKNKKKTAFKSEPQHSLTIADEFLDMGKYPNQQFYSRLLSAKDKVPPEDAERETFKPHTLPSRLARTSELKIEAFLNGFVPLGESLNLMPTKETNFDVLDAGSLMFDENMREEDGKNSRLKATKNSMLVEQEEPVKKMFSDPYSGLRLWRDGVEDVPGFVVSSGGKNSKTTLSSFQPERERRFVSFFRLVDFEQLYRRLIITQGSKIIPLYLWFIPFFGVFLAKFCEYMNQIFVFDYDPFYFVKNTTFDNDSAADAAAAAGRASGKKNSGGGEDGEGGQDSDSSDDDDFLDQPIYRALVKQRDDFLPEHRTDQETLEFCVRRICNGTLCFLVLLNPFIADGFILRVLLLFGFLIIILNSIFTEEYRVVFALWIWSQKPRLFFLHKFRLIKGMFLRRFRFYARAWSNTTNPKAAAIAKMQQKSDAFLLQELQNNWRIERIVEKNAKAMQPELQKMFVDYETLLAKIVRRVGTSQKTSSKNLVRKTGMGTLSEVLYSGGLCFDKSVRLTMRFVPNSLYRKRNSFLTFAAFVRPIKRVRKVTRMYEDELKDIRCLDAELEPVRKRRIIEFTAQESRANGKGLFGFSVKKELHKLLEDPKGLGVRNNNTYGIEAFLRRKKLRIKRKVEKRSSANNSTTSSIASSGGGEDENKASSEAGTESSDESESESELDPEDELNSNSSDEGEDPQTDNSSKKKKHKKYSAKNNNNSDDKVQLKEDEILTAQILTKQYQQMIKTFLKIAFLHAVLVSGGLCLAVICGFLTQEYKLVWPLYQRLLPDGTSDGDEAASSGTSNYRARRRSLSDHLPGVDYDHPSNAGPPKQTRIYAPLMEVTQNRIKFLTMFTTLFSILSTKCAMSTYLWFELFLRNYKGSPANIPKYRSYFNMGRLVFAIANLLFAVIAVELFAKYLILGKDNLYDNDYLNPYFLFRGDLDASRAETTRGPSDAIVSDYGSTSPEAQNLEITEDGYYVRVSETKGVYERREKSEFFIYNDLVQILFLVMVGFFLYLPGPAIAFASPLTFKGWFGDVFSSMSLDMLRKSRKKFRGFLTKRKVLTTTTSAGEGGGRSTRTMTQEEVVPLSDDSDDDKKQQRQKTQAAQPGPALRGGEKDRDAQQRVRRNLAPTEHRRDARAGPGHGDLPGTLFPREIGAERDEGGHEIGSAVLRGNRRLAGGAAAPGDREPGHQGAG
ncbi:unnamed protein product, partial [Amoebophrya sp. A120]